MRINHALRILAAAGLGLAALASTPLVLAAPAEAGAYAPKLFVPTRKVRAPEIGAIAKSGAVAKMGPPAPADGDRAETPETVLTTEIRALADTLGRNPSRIHDWVRNNVEFVPSYGSMQGAAATLESRRGNAFDIASLTIALLRASTISARYARGTIEVPAAVAQDWVGGAGTPLAAATLLTQGGVPNTVVSTAGQVSAIRLEHVWVEAFVDFEPSRGRVQLSSTTWVPLDPSFKLTTTTAGLDGVTLGGFNAATLEATLRQPPAIVGTDGTQNLNAAALGTSFASFEQQLSTRIAADHPNATVGQVLGGREIAVQEYPFLAGALPYKVVQFLDRFAAVPDAYRWKARYRVYASEVDRNQGQAVVGLEQPMVALAGRRITLGFAASSPSERQVLDGLLNQPTMPASLPGYQVRMRPELRLEGAAPVVGATDNLMGTRWLGVASWWDPSVGDWIDAAAHDAIIGETHAIVVVPYAVATSTLNAARDRALAARGQLQANSFAGLGQHELVGELLHFSALSYAGTVEGNARILRDAAGIRGFQLPAIFRAGTSALVTYAGGAPQSVRFQGAVLDTLVLPNTAVSRTADAARAVGFQRLLGARASAYGHLLAERLFGDATNLGQGSSGARALLTANANGLRVHSVTTANVLSVLGQIEAGATTEALVESAAAAGRRTAIPAQKVTLGQWSDFGYAIEDPQTGTAEYEVAGRLAGLLYPSAGWNAAALAGHLIDAGRGDRAAAALTPLLGGTTDIAASVAVLSADYRSVPWSSWAGRQAIASSWWVSAIDNGLAPLLGASVATIVDAMGATTATRLTGLPTPNNAPRITSSPITAAATAQPYQYLVSASDPDGDPISFSLAKAPAGMTISSAGLVSWPAPIHGVHEVIVRVSDGHTSTDQAFFLSVGDVLLLRLAVSVTPQFVTAPGQPVTITVGTLGGRGPVTRTLTVDGAPVTLTNGQATVTAGAIGAHPIVATATDGTETVSESTFYAVSDPADTTTPVVDILSPLNDSEVKGPVDVIGTVTDARLAEWRLYLRPIDSTAFTLIARGTTAKTNEKLGTFDPTTLANGIYQIVLEAVDVNGQRPESAAINLEVTEQLKIGHFSVSFLDLSVEARGIPIQVTRTYDTRRKLEALDFGYGWTVDYQNVKVQKNISTGLGWAVSDPGFALCVSPSAKHMVNVTLPDGRVERFVADLQTRCGPGVGQLPPMNIVFNPAPSSKTTSTLIALEVPPLRFQGNILDDTEVWNPKKFRLTTLERFEYDLEEGRGITKVREPNGNTLTYSDAGIVHSAGTSVTFTRDALKRITAVTDPTGRRLTYRYDAAGDLEAVVDREQKESAHKYDRVHTLTHYTDPRGVQLVRNEYDDAGRLIAQYDANGVKVDLAARNLAANKELVKDRRGNTTTYEYRGDGLVEKMTDADGLTSFTYDDRGNELVVTNPMGHTRTTVYDALDNLKEEKDGLQNSTLYAYVPNSRDLRSITDPRGKVTTLDYFFGNLTSIEDPLHNKTLLGYDNANGGNLVSIKDGANNETTYGYDSQGRRNRETDPVGLVTTFAHDANGNVTRTTRTWTPASGPAVVLDSTRTVDADGNVRTETAPDGTVSRTDWNALKKVAATTDPKGRVTQYDYELRGYESKVTHPDGLFESRTYDPNGNEDTFTDRANRVTGKTYDALNRLKRTTFGDGRWVENGYDLAGRLDTVTDERGKITRHVYDDAGRRTKTIDPTLGEWIFRYDAAGNLIESKDPRLNVTNHEYDDANRRVKTLHPQTAFDTARLEESWTYDGAGRRTSWTDTDGKVTTYEYDGTGRLVAVKQPPVAGSTWPFLTKYAYDGFGNKLVQRDAAGQEVPAGQAANPPSGHDTKWEYDVMGRVTRRTLPKGQFEAFTYDEVGNVATHTNFNGVVIAYTYDALNRLKTKALPGNNLVSYAYTATGQVETLADVRGTTRYQYDLRDRVTRVEHPAGWVVSYAYDAASNRESMTTQYSGQAARTTTYGYDDANRVNRVTDADNQTWSFTYDPAGNRKTMTLPSGVVATYDYDARNRLITLDYRKPGAIAPVSRYEYTWNKQGLRATAKSQSATDGQCTWTYTYDTLGRLTKANAGAGCVPGGDYTFEYDAVGNRIASNTPVVLTNLSYYHDENDRLTKVDRPAAGFEAAAAVNGRIRIAEYDYDAAGNLVRETRAQPPQFPVSPLPDRVTEYRWDAEGRMVGVINPDGTEFTFAYDAEGQLVRKAEGANPTPDNIVHYLPDKNLPFSQILEERDGTGALLAQFEFGAGQVLKQTRGTSSQLYHHDHLSVRMLTDATGAIQATYGFTAFGELSRATGTNASNQPTVTNPHLFAGERIFADWQIVLNPTANTTLVEKMTNGLYYNRARWMEPRWGRFLGMDLDPGSDLRPKSLHDYAYASADPVNKLDPTGRFSLGDVGSAMNSAINIASNASSVYSQFFGREDDQKVDGPTTLWHYLMALIVRGSAHRVSDPWDQIRSPDFMGPHTKPQLHHVIPEYLCGHRDGKKSSIPGDLHTALHQRMYAFGFVVDAAGFTVDMLIFKQPRRNLPRTATQRMGSNPVGRAAIAAFLATFYAWDGSITVGAPPIGLQLLIESPQFAWKHHSAPVCKKGAS